MHSIVMPFDGKSVEVIRNEGGEPFVSVRSVCQAIGVNHSNQYDKLKGNPTFRVECYHSPFVGQEVVCLPLNQLNLWLGSINPMRTQEPVRSNLIAYQRECADVLYRHFMPRGEMDLQPLMDKILEVQNTCNAMNNKFDYLIGMDLTVFGDDASTIKHLIEQAVSKFSMSAPEVWGLVRRECDVSSYKLQNRRVINFLKNLLGEGLRIVKE